MKKLATLLLIAFSLTASAQKYLIEGIDSRNPDKQRRGNADMIAILQIGKFDLRIASIMRDTYVEIPGKGDFKINAAFPIGGEDLMLQTIYHNFGLVIKHHITVDFFNAPAAIDILGGVLMDVTEAERLKINQYVTEQNITNPHKYPLLYKRGLVRLNGGQGLAYSRIRIDGDALRTSRQQQLMTSVLKEIRDKKLFDPNRYMALKQFFNSDIPFEVFMNTGMLYAKKTLVDKRVKIYPKVATFPLEGNRFPKRSNGVDYIYTNKGQMSVSLERFFNE